MGRSASNAWVGLTPRQSEFLDYVRGYVAECGIAPSYSEIAMGLKLSSKSGVHRIAKALSARGHLRRLANMPRSMVVIDRPLIEEPAAKPNLTRDAWLNESVTSKLNASLQALARRTRTRADEIATTTFADLLMEQPK